MKMGYPFETAHFDQAFLVIFSKKQFLYLKHLEQNSFEQL
jgi:hypothetical protein